jgi:hypothetical protein
MAERITDPDITQSDAVAKIRGLEHSAACFDAADSGFGFLTTDVDFFLTLRLLLIRR